MRGGPPATGGQGGERPQTYSRRRGRLLSCPRRAPGHRARDDLRGLPGAAARGHRYLCAACVEDSARRAQTLLATVQTPTTAEPASAAAVDQAPDTDEYAECPN